VVWFFYPETAGRSLEEMDAIFVKCHSYLSVVKIAKDEPRRFGKKGELLIAYEETEEHQRRRSSVHPHTLGKDGGEIARVDMVEDKEV